MVATTRSRSRWRDWTSLPSDIAAMIAQFLLASDLTHFVRFRAVCKNWQDFTAFLKSRAGIFLPRDWILLSSLQRSSPTVPQKLKLLNTANYYLTEISLHGYSLLKDNYSLSGRVNCFLLLEDKKTEGVMSLFNPFTGFLTPLPPLVVSRCGGGSIRMSKALKGGYVTPTGVIFFLLDLLPRIFLVWKNPGCDIWFYYDAGVSCADYFFDKDFFYGMEFDQGLIRIDLVSVRKVATDPVLQIVAPFPEIESDQIVEMTYIFNCDGKIVLVLCPNDLSGDYITYDNYGVMELDNEQMKFVFTKNINSHAIFISREENLSVFCKKSASIPANFVFLCGLTGDEVVSYDVDMNEPEQYFPKSGTCTSHLIRYCFDELNE